MSDGTAEKTIGLKPRSSASNETDIDGGCACTAHGPISWTRWMAISYQAHDHPQALPPSAGPTPIPLTLPVAPRLNTNIVARGHTADRL